MRLPRVKHGENRTALYVLICFTLRGRLCNAARPSNWWKHSHPLQLQSAFRSLLQLMYFFSSSVCLCRVSIKESSVAKLGSVCRRIYRIFSHAYFHHRQIFDKYEVSSLGGAAQRPCVVSRSSKNLAKIEPLLCLRAERDVPVSPVHALCDEVQPDVQGQPDRPHPGGGGPEHFVRRGERSLEGCRRIPHVDGTCTLCTRHAHTHTDTHRNTHTHTSVIRLRL